jgi:hypothetical protein
MRASAHDLEYAVVTRISAFLRDRSVILKLLPAIQADQISAIFARAEAAIHDFSKPDRRFPAVRRLISRIRLESDKLGIEIDRNALRQMLGLPGDPTDAEPIILSAAIARVRQHKDVRLIIGDDLRHATGTRNEPLIALLAEARQAYQELLVSSAGSMTEVARNAKRCRKRLGRLMQIALLAPDIVQRRLEGTQPLALTTTKLLTTDLPVCWSDQRAVLGVY